MNPNNNQSSRGSAPSRGVSPGLRGMGFQGKKTSMTSGHNHSNIPQLSVQPETPLPPLMTRNNSMLTSGSHLGKMAEHQGNKQLPKIIPSSQSESTNHVFRQPAPVSSRSSNGVVFSSHMTSRQTNGMHHISQAGHMMQHISKQDKSEYGPDCLDLNRTQQVYGSKISNSNDGNHFDDKMTNQQLQSLAPTPTPSDVSSIANTPRHQVATPTSMSMASDHSISKSDRGYLLNPGHFPLKNESWGAFKVLPGLGQSGANSVVGSEMGDGPPNCGDMSQYGSLNSLSPFPIPDFSPLGSSLTSPRHSAKQLSKGKRALSISPLSSGGIDLDNLIRLSPTSLSGSRGASSSTSPMPGHVYSGSVGHLQARQSRGNALHLHNGSSAVNSYINYAASSQQSMNANFSQQQNGVKKENEPSPEQYESNSHMIPYMHMASLEQDKPNIAMHTNQMVVPQHQNMSFIEQLYGRNDHQMVPQGQHVPYVETSQFKQEPNGELYPAENGHMVAQLPPTSVGSSIQDPSPMEASVPPPPPYPGAQNFQHSPKPSHSPHTTGMDKKDNGEEPENKQLICKWIDCNHMFKEQSDLVSHIEKQHIDQRKGEENFTCFWQGCVRRYKPFNARYKLLIHMRVHSGEKPNKCTFENCNKAFSRLENLKIHLRSHTGERPYECPHPGCSKAFSNSSDRAKHQRTHKDTKPYACTVPGCNKRYTDPSSLRKHHKNHTSKEQQARKRMRMGEKDEYGGGGGMIDGILSVQAMRHMDDRSPHDMYAGMQFGRHAASHGQGPLGLHNSMPSPAMAPSDEFDRRMDVVGGGFNPAPNGALLAPRRVVGNIVSQPGNQQGASLPTLQGTKLAPGMQGMPPPPPYQEQQYQQPTPVATPGPGDVAQPMQTEEGDTSQQTPSSMMPPYSTYLPVTSSYQHRVHHVNYVPQSGNAPLMNDYANMPCNLQEARMTFGQQSNHGFPAMVPTLEDTLRELPYDAIHLQRALSNHSGSV